MNKLFFHTKHNPKQPRVTVAGVIENGNIKFGVSRCSANDSFVKKVGRSLATERAEKQPFTIIEAPKDHMISWFVYKAKAIAGQVASKPELVHRLAK